VNSLWQIATSPGTVLRCAVVSAAGYAVAWGWPAPGAWVLLQLPAATGGIALAFLVLGEFGREELAQLGGLLFSRPRSVGSVGEAL
jgi:hypothetical protein